MAKKGTEKKKYLTKRILFSRTKRAFKDAAEDAMNLVGYVVVAEDGWVVKKHQDGRVEKIKEIDQVEQPQRIVLD